MTLKLSDYTAGRGNNFNLLRLVAASMVLVSHSFTLATGRPEIEPFSSQIGLTLGAIAVHIFFVTSGFLVTGSLLSRGNIVDFFAARALRIYPALWVSQLLTVLVVGLMFTQLSPEHFFTQWRTWHSILKNCALVRGVDVGLPGAFTHIPFAVGGVNSSLWTLPVELGLYLKLGLAWLLLSWIPRLRLCIFKALALVVASICMLLAILDSTGWLSQTIADGVGGGWLLTGLFFSGAVLRLFQSHVPMSHWLAASLTLALIISGVNQPCFGVVYRLVLPYLVLYLALVPPLRRLHIVTKGDYSYGIYIYAYPVQQGLAALITPISPVQMMLCAGPITFGLAFASWHLVEKHAMSLKEEVARRTRRILTPAQTAPANPS